MTIFDDLVPARLSWGLQEVTNRSKEGRATLVAQVWIRDNTSEAAPVWCDFPIRLLEAVPLAELVKRTLLSQLPNHPLALEYRRRAGEVTAVRLLPEAIEYAGEALHTATRKYVDSKASAILWNSIRMMKRPMWVAVVAATQEALRALPVAGLTRERVGLAVSTAWLKASAELLEHPTPGVAIDQRSATDDYVLRMFRLGCELTESDEWIHGMTALLCEDVAEVAPAA